MKNLHCVLFISLFFVIPAYAQVVTTQPAFPTADAEITLIFDLTLAKDSRATALLGKKDDVYLWSGAGSSETGNAFQFQPAGQTNFNLPFTPGKMTSLGNDKWQIKLVPRTYFGVPAATPIRRLGLLLKSGDGKAQTEDLSVLIYDGRLSLLRLKPTQKDFYIDANAIIPIQAVSSASTTTFTLSVDAQTLLDSTVVRTGPDTLNYSIRAGAAVGVRRTVVLRAKTDKEAVADTFYFTVKPQPAVAELPAGLQDGVNFTAMNRGDIGRATVVLYAPKKSFVYLLGEFNDWTISPAYLMNRTPDGNRYWLELTNLPATETAYQFLVDGTVAVADPYSDKILDRSNDSYIPTTTYPNLRAFPAKAQGNTVSVLQPAQAPFVFQTTKFQRPAVNKLAIYELLVRDFSANRTYKSVQDSLPYLKRLGINTIELMPVMEFTGNNSWGYNPIFYFAPDKAYGTKDDLKRLIDAAHKQGIAVVLDMVLNQADYEFPYVKMYWDGTRPSADSPYFNQQATHPYSVFFDFNHESADTKAFVDRVCKYWLQEYHFDGYRFDLSKGFTQKNTGNDVNAWGAYDASRVAIWKRIYDQIRTVDPTAYVILEHFADSQEEKELADYGMLLWGNHNGDYRGATRSAQGDFSGISYQKRGFQKPNLVGYAESHDEERLVYDLRQNGLTDGSYSIKALPTALDRAKLAASFLLLVPGPKMIWQFGELGYDFSINTCSDGTTISDGCRTDPKPVRWDYYQDVQRQKLYKVYSQLLAFKSTVASVSGESTPGASTPGTNFTTDFSGTIKRLTLRSSTDTTYLIGNFDTKQQKVSLDMPGLGYWLDVFGQRLTFFSLPKAMITLEPGEFHLFTTAKLSFNTEPDLVPFTLKIAYETITGVELETDSQITLSPNPAEEQAVVDITGSYRGAVDITLRDASGRTVRTIRTQKPAGPLRQPLDVQTLSPGVYLLNVQQGDRQRTLKLFVK